MKTLTLFLLALCIVSCKTKDSSSKDLENENIATSKYDLIIDSCENGKIKLSKLKDIEFFNNNAEIPDDSLIINNYFEYKKKVREALEIARTAIIEDNRISGSDKAIPSECNITSFEKFIAVDSNVFIFHQPSIFVEIDRKDTIHLLDEILVPFFNGSPFYVKNSIDLFPDHRFLCYHNGTFGFFSNKSCIPKNKIFNIDAGNYSIGFGDKIIIINNSSEKASILPKHSSFFSKDSMRIAYVIKSSSLDTINYAISTLRLFDLRNWTDTLLGYGVRPHFFNFNDTIVYFEGYNKYPSENRLIKLSCATSFL